MLLQVRSPRKQQKKIHNVTNISENCILVLKYLFFVPAKKIMRTTKVYKLLACCCSKCLLWCKWQTVLLSSSFSNSCFWSYSNVFYLNHFFLTRSQSMRPISAPRKEPLTHGSRRNFTRGLEENLWPICGPGKNFRLTRGPGQKCLLSPSPIQKSVVIRLLSF